MTYIKWYIYIYINIKYNLKYKIFCIKSKLFFIYSFNIIFLHLNSHRKKKIIVIVEDLKNNYYCVIIEENKSRFHIWEKNVQWSVTNIKLQVLQSI